MESSQELCAHERLECGSGGWLIWPVASDSSMLFSVCKAHFYFYFLRMRFY